MLTDRQHIQQVKRLQKIIKPWSRRLGLGDWNASVIVSQDELGVSALDADANVLASCYASWPYKQAHVEFSGPAMIDIDDDDLTRAVIHELMHCLVNEMSKGKGPNVHEERVVTDLTNAVVWTYEAGYDEGYKDATRELKRKQANESSGNSGTSGE